jgi:protein-S-isoprenylcysteine O-methyltransferase Ste14
MSVFSYVPLIGFLLLIIVLIIKILVVRNKGIRISSGSGIKSNWLTILFIIPFFLLLFEIFKPLFFNSFSILPKLITNPLFDSYLIKIAGSFLVLISLILWIITLFHFKSSLRFGLDENNFGKLITNGIFQFSRNPFFLAIDFYFVGIAFLKPNIFFIGFAILAIGIIHFFILKEEKHMKKVYKDEYENFTKNVRRYF